MNKMIDLYMSIILNKIIFISIHLKKPLNIMKKPEMNK